MGQHLAAPDDGDAASMVNVPTLKGVHYAMHAGMYAAEAIRRRYGKITREAERRFSANCRNSS